MSLGLIGIFIALAFLLPWPTAVTPCCWPRSRPSSLPSWPGLPCWPATPRCSCPPRGASSALGARHAIGVTVVSTALLTYGGVNGWVVVFTIFPIAMSLFKLADVPRLLMAGAVAFGIFTFATAALPGTPHIHNAIPAIFFGTDTFAAPWLSIIGSVLVFGLGMLWLTYRERTLKAADHSFSDPTHNERTGRIDPSDLSVKCKAAQDQQPADTAG